MRVSLQSGAWHRRMKESLSTRSLMVDLPRRDPFRRQATEQYRLSDRVGWKADRHTAQARAPLTA